MTQNHAEQLRRMWLHLLGLDSTFADENIEIDPPTSFEDELAQLVAAFRIGKSPVSRPAETESTCKKR